MFLLNTRGLLAREPHVVEALILEAQPRHGEFNVLLFTETHQLPGQPLPTLQGYSLTASQPGTPSRCGKGRGGVAIYVRSSLVGRVQQWRCWEGVAWVCFRGETGRPLYLAACYLPPGRSSEELAMFFGRLQQDTVAAQAAGAEVCIGGDINARTACEPDWVESDAGYTLGESAAGLPELAPRIVLSQRNSCDGVVNSQGRALLGFCAAAGVGIANGRTDGDAHGEWTFHSLANAGKSVVDYFILSAELLGCAANRLVVCPPGDRFDHCGLALTVNWGVFTAASPVVSDRRVGPSPCGLEFCIEIAKIPGFVEAVAGAAAQAQLGAIEGAAEAATSLDQLSAACDGFCELVAQSLAEAGMRARGTGPARCPPAWQRHAERRPVTSRLRRQRRRALSRHDYALAVALNRQICAAARRHKRAQRRVRARELEELYSSDPAAFFKQLKGREDGPESSISTADWIAHFESLLAASTAPTGAPPSPPAPTTEAVVAAVGEGLGAHRGSQSPSGQSTLATARERLHGPFTTTELTAAMEGVPNGKSVLGALKPRLLKAASAHLAPALTSLLNACVRLGGLPSVWAMSALTPIRKPGADHLRCDGYRGIAVGTLPAKLYAAMLNARITSFAEAAGIRASGQAGFRKGYGCSDQQFALRALIERQRARGDSLYACFVDFKQAFDRINRTLLWEKLHRIGLGGWALQAVQALYADVPMCVRVPGGFTPAFQATSGVKQGCPLSPLLFGLFLDDFEAGLLQQAEAATLPTWHNGVAVPPLLYADDQALLATTPAGLRHQLGYLAQYCAKWGLEVNTKKTKVVVFSSSATARQGSFTYGGSQVDTVPVFRYLGMHFHQCQAFASAASYRAQAGRRAMHLLRRRMAENGLASPILSLKLFQTYVLPTLSYGAELWGPQLVIQGTAACERTHTEFLRSLLGVRCSTPKLTLLAETGQLPLAAHWTKQIARFVNRLRKMEDSRIARQALLDNIHLATTMPPGTPLARQPWAAQVHRLLADAGAPGLLDGGPSVNIAELTAALIDRHIGSYTSASVMVQRYVADVWEGGLASDTYAPAMYLHAVPERRGRQRLAQLRTGSHWLAEATGRWERRPRDQRLCPHCHDGLEDAHHVVFQCPLYQGLRDKFAGLFEGPDTMTSFLGQARQPELAQFVHLCHAAHEVAREPQVD